MLRTRTHVLQLVTRMNVGGPAAHIRDVTRMLGDRFDMRLAAGTPPHEEGRLTAEALLPIAVSLERELRPFTDVRALSQVRRLLRRTSPDILHTHMAKAGAIGRLAARATSPPPRTVHTFHGHVLDGYFGPVKQRAFIEAERALARSTDVLVAVSPEIRDDLLSLRIGRPEQYEVVGVGIDVGSFSTPRRPGSLRTFLGLAPSTLLVGVLGRLTQIKDHATLLHALRGVPEMHLAVLGDGELRGPLGRLAAELGITDRVHFTGWWQDVPGALVDLDIVALTSRNEGTPLSLMEAAAAGVPVVATAVGGVPGIVEHDGSGLLVSVGRPDAVADALHTLGANATRRHRMGRRGQQIAHDRFDAAAAAERLAKVYRRLVGGPRQSSN